MKILIILTIILITTYIYILSFKYMYKYTQKMHSKGGDWSGLNVGAIDVFFTVTPFFNTIIAIFQISEDYVNNRKNNFNKFFNIKK